MTIKEFITNISVDWNDIYFIYNNKRCGVISDVRDSKPIFRAWYGEKIKTHTNVNDLMNDKFYDGKTLTELVPLVNFVL